MATDWIDAMADEECLEVFRLYAESADEMIERYGASRIAGALRYALRRVAATQDIATDDIATRDAPSDEPR